jgi:SAM-dependent methyltransferase
MLLGEICSLTSTTRQLDLCCGKGEMLCVWSQRYGIRGIGVDISPVFLKAAHARAAELNCSDRITFVEGDASTYAIAPSISCSRTRTRTSSGLSATMLPPICSMRLGMPPMVRCSSDNWQKSPCPLVTVIIAPEG